MLLEHDGHIHSNNTSDSQCSWAELAFWAPGLWSSSNTQLEEMWVNYIRYERPHDGVQSFSGDFLSQINTAAGGSPGQTLCSNRKMSRAFRWGVGQYAEPSLYIPLRKSHAFVGNLIVFPSWHLRLSLLLVFCVVTFSKRHQRTHFLVENPPENLLLGSHRGALWLSLEFLLGTRLRGTSTTDSDMFVLT